MRILLLIDAGGMCMKKIVSVVLAAAVVSSLVLLSGCQSSKSAEIQTYTVDKSTLKIGILSDLQLAPEGGSDVYDQSFQSALEFFKSQNVDMLINVGDYTDVGNEESYKNYKRIYDSVYGGEDIISSYILGNHDYWLQNFVDCWEIPFKGKMRSRFEKYTVNDNPWTHKVVNGFHFIAVSPDKGGMDDSAYSDKTLEWAKEQIELAIEQSPDKPVFVLTHHPPKGSLIMSQTDGCENLDKLFSQYEQVVSISGHTHAPLMDETSIVQDNYTAINTQCVSYICYAGCDLTQDDGSFIEDNPMVMILELSDSQAVFHRYSALTGEEQKEPWVLSLPLSKVSFAYNYDTRKSQSTAPVWESGFDCSIGTVEGEEGTKLDEITFTAAQHPDAVAYYDIQLVDGAGNPVSFKINEEETKDTLRVGSDYILPAENRSSTVNVIFPAEYTKDLSGEYTLQVTPLDCYENAGETVSATVTF